MAQAELDAFDKRMERIAREHRRLARGYVTTIGADGLMRARPRRQGLRLPLRGLFTGALLMLLFKALFLAHLGAGGYQARVEAIGALGPAGQAAAWVMAADPATVWIAARMGESLPDLF